MASFTPFENMVELTDRTAPGSSSGFRAPTGIVIDKSCRVYITQIPVSRIERDGAVALRAEFEIFGPLESYKMFMERSGRFIGSAICTYRNPADAALAVTNMDGQLIDESPIKVALARDHGVMLLHQENPNKQRGFLRRDDVDDGEKWHHDKYEMMIEGNNMDEVLGYRKYSDRGRGGRRGRGRSRGRFMTMNGDSTEGTFESDIMKQRKALDEALMSYVSLNTTGADDSERKAPEANDSNAAVDVNASSEGMPPTALS